MKICKVGGCSEKSYIRGYCNRHYQQLRDCGQILERTIRDPNEIIIKGNVAEVVLYKKNKELARTIIDTEDARKIKKHKWRLSQGYVTASIGEKTVGIAHVVTGINPNYKRIVDHKDRNPLNNRKNNLRVCTRAENNRNATKQKNNKSGYKGVSWNKCRNGWRVQICVNYKPINLGLFKNKKEAAKAYNTGAIKYFGEFAYLNKI